MYNEYLSFEITVFFFFNCLFIILQRVYNKISLCEGEHKRVYKGHKTHNAPNGDVR